MVDHATKIRKAGYQPEWFRNPHRWRQELKSHCTACEYIDAGNYKMVNLDSLIKQLARPDQIHAVELIKEVRASPNKLKRDFIKTGVWCSKAGFYHNLTELDFLNETDFWNDEDKPNPKDEYCWTSWEP